MSAKDVKIGTAVDAVTWIKNAIVAAATTPPGSPARRRKLDEIALGIARARQMADGYRGKMAAELRIAVSVAELGVSKLRERGRDDRGRSSEGSDGARARKRVHPRIRDGSAAP
jgi:hypothetical protein